MHKVHSLPMSHIPSPNLFFFFLHHKYAYFQPLQMLRAGSVLTASYMLARVNTGSTYHYLKNEYHRQEGQLSR